MASLPSASSSASLLAPGRSLISPTQPPRLKPSSPAGSWMTPSSEMLSLTTIFPIFRSFRWRCQLARRRAYWRCVAEGATPPLEGCQIRPRRRRVAHDTPCYRHISAARSRQHPAASDLRLPVELYSHGLRHACREDDAAERGDAALRSRCLSWYREPRPATGGQCGHSPRSARPPHLPWAPDRPLVLVNPGSHCHEIRL